jgi:hypothetical protein
MRDMRIDVHCTVTLWSVDGPGTRAFADGEDARGADRVFHAHNVVTASGLQAVRALLAGLGGSPTVGGISVTTLAGASVATMQLGRKSSPTAPTSSDTTGVYGTGAYSAAPVVVYGGTADEATVRFSLYLGAGAWFPNVDANGNTALGQTQTPVFTEEALMLGVGRPFAKRILTGLPAKPVSNAWRFDHIIYITAPA